MIDTNALLSIAFTLISNFTNVVPIPPEQVPQRREDLTRILVGTPISPFDLYLVHKQGSEFWIRRGAIFQYFSPTSYFHMQDFAQRWRLAGPPTLSSNEVVQTAARVMNQLVKRGNPFEGVTPVVKTTAASDLHFYYVSWPVSNMPVSDGLGSIEIDARNGAISSVTLWAREFNDLAFAAEISNRVYTPDLLRTPSPDTTTSAPKPTPKQVAALIPKWLYFCQHLGINPGGQTNVSDVDWTETLIFTDPPVPGEGRDFKIQFKNGTGFEFRGRVLAHWSGDAAFLGGWADQTREHWEQFRSPPAKTWQNMARDLSAHLVRSLGVSEAYLSTLTPKLCAWPNSGARCLVAWCNTEELRKHQWYDLPQAMRAEFDLQDGRIFILRLEDPELAKWQPQGEP